MVSKARFKEIVEDAFQPHNSIFKRRERQIREQELIRQEALKKEQNNNSIKGL